MTQNRNTSAMKATLRRIVISIAVALGILVIDYFVENWMGYIFDDSQMLAIFNRVLPPDPKDDSDFVTYYNIAYDKQLVAVSDEYGDSIGCIDITNRKNLLRFLEIAEKSNYKYIFLDVRFDKRYMSDEDSLLFSKIISMRDIVISTHYNSDCHYEIADNCLLPKAAYADHMSTYFSGFTKYSYLQRDSASVALKLYNDMDGGRIRRIGPFFVSNGSLCNNMQFLSFTDSDISDVEIPKEPPFGGEVLQMLSEEEIIDQMNDKIVVVGDMVSDIHNTYVGTVPGSLINIRAYEYLAKGKHLVNFYLILFLLVIYSVCVYFILYAPFDRATEKIRTFIARHPLVVFLLLMCGWSFVLSLIKFIVFKLFQESIIIFIPSLVFSVLSMPSDYNNFKRSCVINYKKNENERITL